MEILHGNQDKTIWNAPSIKIGIICRKVSLAGAIEFAIGLKEYNYI